MIPNSLAEREKLDFSALLPNLLINVWLNSEKQRMVSAHICRCYKVNTDQVAIVPQVVSECLWLSIVDQHTLHQEWLDF